MLSIMPAKILYQILRIAGRADYPGARLSKHIDGRVRPETAISRPGVPDVRVMRDSLDMARKAVQEAMKKPRPGRPPWKSVDLVFGGPPPASGPDAWPVEKVDAWAEATVQWVSRKVARSPGTILALAALHWDENSPHVHVQLAPLRREGKPGKKGSTRLSIGIEAMNRCLAGVDSTKPITISGRKLLSMIQDSYHREVGRKFGLARGESVDKKRKGAVRRHAPTDPVIAMENRLHAAEQSVQVAEQKVEVAEQKIGVAEQKAETAEQKAEESGQRAIDAERNAAQARRSALDAEKNRKDAERKRAAEERRRKAEEQKRIDAEQKREAAEKQRAESEREVRRLTMMLEGQRAENQTLQEKNAKEHKKLSVLKSYPKWRAEQRAKGLDFPPAKGKAKPKTPGG